MFQIQVWPWTQEAAPATPPPPPPPPPPHTHNTIKCHSHENQYHIARPQSGQYLSFVLVIRNWDSSWQNLQKWHVRSSKTQISLDFRPVWSESSLFAWRKLGSLATHWAHSEVWSDWVDAQADLSLHWAHMSFCWFCHAVVHIGRSKGKCALMAYSRKTQINLRFCRWVRTLTSRFRGIDIF